MQFNSGDLRDKTMADKLMNITNNKTSNYPLLYIINSG